jgi:hypothetical protein
MQGGKYRVRVSPPKKKLEEFGGVRGMHSGNGFQKHKTTAMISSN